MTKEAREKYIENTFNVEGAMLMSIDQVVFRLVKRGYNSDYYEHYKKGKPISLSHEGKVIWIHFHDYCIKQGQTIIQSIYDALYDNYYYSPYPLYDRVIPYEEILNEMVLTTLEIACDFQHKVFPFYINYGSLCFRGESFQTKVATTLYSNDSEVVKYKMSNRDMLNYSLVCIYNRTERLKSVTPKEEWHMIPDNLTRFEYRLKGKYLKGRKAKAAKNGNEAIEEIKPVTTKDLKLFPVGLVRRLRPILTSYTKEVLKPHSIWFVNSKIYKKMQPYLYNIFLECKLVPLKSKDLESIKHDSKNNLPY